MNVSRLLVTICLMIMGCVDGDDVTVPTCDPAASGRSGRYECACWDSDGDRCDGTIDPGCLDCMWTFFPEHTGVRP